MIQQLWPTPVYRSKFDIELNNNLINALLLNYDMRNAPSDFGDVNILDSSDSAIFQFKDEVIYPAFNSFLKETLGKQITDWGGHRLKGWIAGTSDNYSLAYHNHRGAQLSAVFYLLCEEQNRGGQITFTDPRQNSNRGYDESFEPWFEDLSFIPKTGEFIVFPSFLYHYVSTYQSNIRLAIPVDLFLHNKS